MKQQIVAAFFAFASAVSGQMFQINGGNPIVLTDNDMANGKPIAITLKVPMTSQVIVNFDSSPTANVDQCQLQFEPNRVDETKYVTIKPVRAKTSSYQVTMNIYVSNVPGIAGGTCIWSTQTISMTAVLYQQYPDTNAPSSDPPGICTFYFGWTTTFDGAYFLLSSLDNYDLIVNTLFQTIDTVTVIQVGQKLPWSYVVYPDETYMMIKHYDAYLIFGMDPSYGLFPGNSPDAIKCNLDNDGNGQCTLSNGITVTRSLNQGTFASYNYKFTVPDKFRNKVTGVCGNFNGDANDEDWTANYRISNPLNNNYNSLRSCDTRCSDFNNAPRDPNVLPDPPGIKCTVGARPNTCQNLVEVTSFVTTC